MGSEIFQNWEIFYKERYKGWSGAEQFSGSGARLERLVDEMCWPSDKIKKEVDKQLKSVFSSDFSEMLTLGPTNVWTLCPHHLLPCNFKVYVGYVPTTGKVLGLSKFSRIAVALARRPIMQEQYSKDLADALEVPLSCKGLGIHVIGKHGCMGCRGVLQDEVEVVTTVLRGCILTESDCKQEFLMKVIN